MPLPLHLWGPQVLSGLAHMHRKGFFHRDLKPDNLLVSAAGALLNLGMGLVHASGIPRKGKLCRIATNSVAHP